MVVAKAIVVGAVALAIGLLSVPLSRLVAAIWFAFGDGSWNGSFGTAAHYAIGVMVALVGYSALGVMTGTLARSPALGVGIALGALVAIDPLLGSFSFYSEYSLSGVSQTLIDPDNRQAHQPLFGSAIALLALYSVVLTWVTLAIERNRDVSA